MILKSFRQLSTRLRTHQLAKVVDWTGLTVVAVSTITITGCILGVRQLGWLQARELIVYDQMLRIRPSAGTDSRILIVAITEGDVKRYKIPLSDQLMAQTLETLQRDKPSAIGIDIYRDIPQPPGAQELATQLKQPNVFAITNLGNADNPEGIPPPAAIDKQQVGFNDVVTDPDGVVRRSLIQGKTNYGQSIFSLSLQMGIFYLRQQTAPTTDPQDPNIVVWGKAAFTPLTATSGAYQTLDNGGYQLLLNYRGAKNSFPQVTLSDVLDGKVSPDLVKGKLVLIGSTSISAKDFFFTPFSASEKDSPRMFGVEIHAHMLSQILDAVDGSRRPFWFWNEWVEVAWIIGWAVVGGAIAWRFSHPVVVITGNIVIILAIAGIGYGIFLHQGWVPIVTPILTGFLTSGTVLIYQAQQAQRQQRMVMTLLGQSTSPEIAEALWQSRDSLLASGMLPGQAMTATMLFTDIKDFSTISEQMTPQELLTWLNEYLAAMTQEIQRHGGIVNKFIGDGVMAVFGVPVPHTDQVEIGADARHAVQAALAMGDRLAQLNQYWGSKHLPTIQIRAGIYTGDVVAGSIGSKDRMEYGVIGDSVNIASRLESCAKDRQQDLCRILVAQQTLNYIIDEFDIEPWGPMSLKGKHQTVDVYRILGRSSPSSVATVPVSNSAASQPVEKKIDVI